MSTKEWENCYMLAIKDIAKKENLSFTEAECKLIKKLEEIPNYLEKYLTWDK
jgi:Asp-tRNA(Asn)/Glu-tRNA(Gln) amidotransferase C subunit